MDLVSRLKTLDSSFLPSHVYILTEMWQVFYEPLDTAFNKKILSGSPGIGKSVLLFLLVLYPVTTEENTNAIYLHYATSESHAIAFVLSWSKFMLETFI
jgi:hypothetical protein